MDELLPEMWKTYYHTHFIVNSTVKYITKQKNIKSFFSIERNLTGGNLSGKMRMEVRHIC
jgi:hypothetical protein